MPHTHQTHGRTQEQNNTWRIDGTRNIMNNERLETACVQMLNCAKGHATTTSALFSFASNPSTILILLQEPAIEHNQLPPSHPAFHLLTPIPERPLYVTYVCRLPGVQADIVMAWSQSS
jgi:hypothetical protein